MKNIKIILIIAACFIVLIGLGLSYYHYHSKNKSKLIEGIEKMSAVIPYIEDNDTKDIKFYIKFYSTKDYSKIDVDALIGEKEPLDFNYQINKNNRLLDGKDTLYQYAILIKSPAEEIKIDTITLTLDGKSKDYHFGYIETVALATDVYSTHKHIELIEATAFEQYSSPFSSFEINIDLYNNTNYPLEIKDVILYNNSIKYKDIFIGIPSVEDQEATIINGRETRSIQIKTQFDDLYQYTYIGVILEYEFKGATYKEFLFSSQAEQESGFTTEQFKTRGKWPCIKNYSYYLWYF